MAGTQTIKAVCYGGPHDGDRWRIDGCKVNFPYVLDTRCGPDFPPNAPIYFLVRYCGSDELRWVFDGYVRPPLR